MRSTAALACRALPTARGLFLRGPGQTAPRLRASYVAIYTPRAPAPLAVPRLQHPPPARASVSSMASHKLELEVVDIHNPGQHNFILGHSHFIKTVEDLAEVMAGAGGGAKWGVAFCEASGDPQNEAMPGRKVRSDGNDAAMLELAKRNAMALGAGHTFVIFMDGIFPVAVLNAVKAVPEVCRVYCATANPVSVVVARLGEDRKGIMGVLDGLCPVDFETEGDKEKRKAFLRMIGYKR
ncbi:hypothetical protein Rsub_08024 [Raphidocelis subcapitata]|uniref:Adenosine monophosphate-protein transferase n=1 Tax=Raphidocelis subcapitata TaxID=307507 RepID=A0A2V0P7E8_9CHLO|nr:hypothetical protein Rsub_08024 [Raphidocelis subcapitata]|eukprot:GBF94852.1 hypothetical protein Rsub_08024 [Raphidocelis subcapitata]